MNILVLHGINQNVKIMKEQCKNIEKYLTNITFHYSEGSYIIDNETSTRSWWNENFANFCMNFLTKKSSVALGIHETMDELNKIWDAKKYDGIIGFSQGTLVATLLAEKVNPKFVILFSGFIEPFPTNVDKVSTLDIPSLHIWGKNDFLVPAKESFKLSQLYISADYHIHNGAHEIPTEIDTMKYIDEFISSIS